MSQSVTALRCCAYDDKALNARIVSLARTHDLLTERRWSGADLVEVVSRAMAPFATGQIAIDGPSVNLSPKQALAISLALHELTTNAVKYGALSTPEGRVDLRWQASQNEIRVDWQEIGGPEVMPRARRGFGSRLLEEALSRDLSGRTELRFAPTGVCCSISARPQPMGTDAPPTPGFAHAE